MSIAQIEVKSGQASGATATATFTTSTTVGELIVVIAGGENGGTMPTISDSGSQSYTLISSNGAITGGFGYGIWYVQNSASGISSVSANPGANRAFIMAGHYTGVATASALDQSSGIASGGTSPWNSAAVTTTTANELLIGGCLALFGTGNANLAASGSWTQDIRLGFGVWDNNGGNDAAYAHQIVSSIQTNIQNTGTNSGAGTAYPGIVTFKAAAAANPTPLACSPISQAVNSATY